MRFSRCRVGLGDHKTRKQERGHRHEGKAQHPSAYFLMTYADQPQDIMPATVPEVEGPRNSVVLRIQERRAFTTRSPVNHLAWLGRAIGVNRATYQRIG